MLAPHDIEILGSTWLRDAALPLAPRPRAHGCMQAVYDALRTAAPLSIADIMQRTGLDEIATRGAVDRLRRHRAICAECRDRTWRYLPARRSAAISVDVG